MLIRSYVIKTIKRLAFFPRKFSKLRGSYTVEASLIFPFICLVLVAVLVTCVYIHDEVVLQSIADLAVSKNILTNTHNQSKWLTDEKTSNQQINSFVTNKVRQELIMKEGNLNIDYKVKNTIISSQLEVDIVKDFRLPFKLINKFLNGNRSSFIKIHVHSLSSQNNPSNIVRGIDFIDDITDELNITKELKEKYENDIEELENTINQWI